MSIDNIDLQTLQFNHHALKRKQQRGITESVIECVFKYGQVYDVGSGCEAHWLNKQAFNMLSKSEKRKAEKGQNIAVILSEDASVVTIMHCDKQMRHWSRI